MLPIIKKEIRVYFNSMTAYIYLTFFVLITAVYFSLYSIYSQDPYYAGVLSGTSIMFLILIPTLTMRLFADEAKQKTDQLLYTSPVTIPQIVVGKYISAFCLFLIGMAITMLFPIILSGFGTIPTAQIFGAFVGYILLGAAFVSIGMFISVLTENQIIAAVASFAVLFFMFIMNSIASMLPADRVPSLIFIAVVCIALSYFIYDSTKNIFVGLITGAVLLAICVIAYLLNNMVFDGILVKVFTWLSVMARFDNFNKGVLNLADIVYFISFSAAFIYLTINFIEKRRWR